MEQVKGYGLLSFVRNLCEKYGKDNIEYCYKKQNQVLENCF